MKMSQSCSPTTGKNDVLTDSHDFPSNSSHSSPFEEEPSTSASSLLIFLSGNPDELCNRIRLIIQEKQGETTKVFDDETIAMNDKLLKYKCITPTHHKKNLTRFNLL